MPIIPPAIRPPSEADSVLLQITTGCSANGCTFCGAYLNKPFRIKALPEIEADIELEARYQPGARRVFLMDGDALAIPVSKLLPILEKIQTAFPRLTRIAAYVNGFNFNQRTDAELVQLAQRKLTLLYMGLESGSQQVLDACEKRATVDEMITTVLRAKQAQIKTSVIVLLGLGGKELYQEHVTQTIAALNRMQPRYLSFLTLMLIPGTPLYAAQQAGRFEALDTPGFLQQAKDLLSGLELTGTIFRSNHASNYIDLEGRLPQDQQRMIQALEQAITGTNPVRPEYLRGL